MFWSAPSSRKTKNDLLKFGLLDLSYCKKETSFTLQRLPKTNLVKGFWFCLITDSRVNTE